MIRHIVLLQIPSHIARDKIDSMFDQLQQIALAMPGTVAFCSGANMPGSGLHQGFTHVINIDFIDETARDTYVAELDRDRIGGRLSDMTEGGLGGILIMNINLDHVRTRDNDNEPGVKSHKPQLRWV